MSHKISSDHEQTIVVEKAGDMMIEHANAPYYTNYKDSRAISMLN